MFEREITVLCVDDSRDIAELLDVSITAEEGISSVGIVEDTAHVAAEAARLKPDIVLLDFTMPGKDMKTLIAEIAESHSDARTIVYSGYDDHRSVDEAMEAGAWGYVSKHAEFKCVIDAIRRVAGGEVVLAGR